VSKIKITSIPTTKELELINNNKFTFENKEGKIEVVDYSIVNDEVEEFFKKPLILRDPEREKFERFWDRYANRYLQLRPNSNVLWSQFQTSIKNQEHRNTCSGFAMIAAIEARYKRDYNLDLDLSEQFFWHCFKSTDLHYPTERTYENQISFHGGGNPHEIVRSAINISLPLEETCPYLSKQEMIAIRDSIPEAGMLKWKGSNIATQEEVDAFEYSTFYISNEARQNAYYGLESYLVLKESFVRNILKMEKTIALGYEIIVSLRLKWKINAVSGVYEFNKNEDRGSHVFLIVGYDRD